MTTVVSRHRVWLLLTVALGACGCGGALPRGSGTYCQSGPKYGTECYSDIDVTDPPGHHGPPPPPEQRKEL
jgi:hypothetical protein